MTIKDRLMQIRRKKVILQIEKNDCLDFNYGLKHYERFLLKFLCIKIMSDKIFKTSWINFNGSLLAIFLSTSIFYCFHVFTFFKFSIKDPQTFSTILSALLTPFFFIWVFLRLHSFLLLYFTLFISLCFWILLQVSPLWWH